MKTRNVLLLSAAFACGIASAQTNSAPGAFTAPSSDNPPYVPPPAVPKPHVVDVPQPGQTTPEAPVTPAPPTTPTSSPSDNVDPAKIAEYQARFQQGYALEQAGKLKEARDVYDGILAEQPQAKRSLLEAGRISFQLGDLQRANDYLEKLHAIVPDFPEAIELLIPISQALNRDVRAELLIQQFKQFYADGKIPAKPPWFLRELIHSAQQDIEISQFFDYTQDPYTVWMAKVYDANNNLKRWIMLRYDPDATGALRAKDAKYANTQVFLWVEPELQDGQPRKIDAYLQIFALPDYQKFRSAMLIILANPPAPIYSTPVDTTQQ